MNTKEKIEELLKKSKGNTITVAQVTEAGLHRNVLQELVYNGEIYRFGRGLYVLNDAREDDLYLLQRKYGRGSIHTILLCICWVIQTVPLQNIR